MEKTTQQELQNILDTAMDLFSQAETGWRQQRLQSLDDMRFYHGKQWDDQLLQVARLRKEPTLQVNRLPTFVKQVENEMRQRELSININATDAEGSDDTANIFSGIIRGIEQRSNAKAHYIHAAGENGALVPGFGFVKVCVDYADATGFEQDITIDRVDDPFKVLPDPAALQPDFSDASFWFEFEDYPEDTFKRKFPFAQCSSAEMFPVGARQSDWLGESTIRVARFWYKEEVVNTTFLLEDGTVVTEEVVDTIIKDENDGKRYAMIGDDAKVILRNRVVSECIIKWCDFTAAEILDEGDWAGKYFPFVAITGPIAIVDGSRDIRGIIRFAKDAQKMLNYMASSAARRIASANKSPWIVAQESIVGHERAWQQANTTSMPYLLYNAFDPQRQNSQNPAPQRADQTGQIQDLLVAAQKYEDDLKATIGIYDAGLGATPNEQSGVAIKTLAQQGQNANYHFSDNLVVALQRLGNILLDLIPKIYDTPRVLRSIQPDGQAQLVRVNQIFNKDGTAKEYNLRDASGHYGVTVNVGPAFATAKQAAIEKMLELVRANPAIAPYVQDIMARNMDFSGKEVVADRLMRLLAQQSPGIIEEPGMEDIPPQAQAAIAQQGAIIQQLQTQLQAVQAEYQQLNFALQSKTVEHQHAVEKARIDADLQMQLETQKTQDTLLINEQKQRTEMAVQSAEMEMTAIKTQLAHTEKMLNLVVNAMKQFGTNADEVIAEVVPAADAIVDAASLNNQQF